MCHSVFRAAARAALVVLCLWSVAVPARARGGDGTAGEELLHRLARKYAGLSTLSADFRQEVPLQNVGIIRKAAGRVYFRRPLRMRWDYRKPDEQLFLSDGRYLYYRPPASRRVFRRPLDEKALGGRVPLLLLFGRDDITEYFRVAETVPLKGGRETALRLVPKGEGAPGVRRLDLVVEDADLGIREVHLYDRLGGANHLFFDHIAFDPPLPRGFFRFRKPPGVEVVDR